VLLPIAVSISSTNIPPKPSRRDSTGRASPGSAHVEIVTLRRVELSAEQFDIVPLRDGRRRQSLAKLRQCFPEYRLETQVTPGGGAMKLSGMGSDSGAKESVKVGFDYFRANASRVSASIKAADHDYHLHFVELHSTGPTTTMTLATFVALCSSVLGKPVQQQMVVLGSMSLGGSIVPVQNLAESLQVAFDAGAKRLLLPMASVSDIPTVSGELFAKFQTSFYADPVDSVFKAMGVQ